MCVQSLPRQFTATAARLNLDPEPAPTSHMHCAKEAAAPYAQHQSAILKPFTVIIAGFCFKAWENAER